MRTAALFALAAVALAAVALAEDEPYACEKKNFKCVGEGDECQDVFDEDDFDPSQKLCAFGYYCVEEGGKKRCLKGTLDLKCDENADCLSPGGFGSQGFGCFSGKCEPVGAIGDYCSNTEHCTEGECKDGRCQKGTEGGECRSDEECPVGTICGQVSATEGKCVKPSAKAGEACSGGCKPGFECKISDLKCIELYAGKKGEECTRDKYCKTDLSCDRDTGKCVDGNKDNVEYKKCSKHADCGEDGGCMCYPFLGEGYCMPEVSEHSVVCKGADKDYEICLTENYCSHGGVLPTGDGKHFCAQKHCLGKFKKTVSCGGSCNAPDRTDGSDCAAGYLRDFACGGLSVGAIVGILVAVVAIVAVAAVLVYFFCFRKSG